MFTACLQSKHSTASTIKEKGRKSFTNSFSSVFSPLLLQILKSAITNWLLWNTPPEGFLLGYFIALLTTYFKTKTLIQGISLVCSYWRAHSSPCFHYFLHATSKFIHRLPGFLQVYFQALLATYLQPKTLIPGISLKSSNWATQFWAPRCVDCIPIWENPLPIYFHSTAIK